MFGGAPPYTNATSPTPHKESNENAAIPYALSQPPGADVVVAASAASREHDEAILLRSSESSGKRVIAERPLIRILPVTTSRPPRSVALSCLTVQVSE